MAELVLSERAIADLDRIADFLAESDALAAEATVALIVHALKILVAHPRIGRASSDDLRELIISQGRTGFVALYEYHAVHNRILVHAIRHQREAGFEEI
jgi:plasmid stabilization system protein ParE